MAKQRRPRAPEPTVFIASNGMTFGTYKEKLEYEAALLEISPPTITEVVLRLGPKK